MKRRLWLDLETFNEKPIQHGTYAYAETAEVTIATYAFDDEDPVYAWDATTYSLMPDDLSEAFADPDCEVVAHNAPFDRTVLRQGNLKIDIPIERWRCTMAQALAHSLPGKLESLGAILGVHEDKRKLAEGKSLVQLFCKPRPKNSKLRRATRATHPAEWLRFLEYAKQDIVSMREIARKMPVWNYRGEELALWHLDQRINDRGVCIDVELVEAAVRTVNREQKRLKEEVQLTTGFDREAETGVESAGQRDKLLRYILEEYGVDLPDMQASTLERRVNDPDLPQEARDLIAMRMSASTTSTTKYKSLSRGVSSDGRLRGILQFCGAMRTGRWAGRLFQPQNLPRPVLEAIARWFGVEVKDLTDEMFGEYIDFVVLAIKADALDLIADEVMAHCSNLIRSTIIAPPATALCVADLANIEGRVAAWLAGEAWKVQAFRDYDAGLGPDLYKLAYAKSFKIDPSEVSKTGRQIGKVQELMLQYEGGVGAFVTGSETYGIDLEEMARTAYGSLPTNERHEAEGFLSWAQEQGRSTFGLSDEAFVTCDTFKRLWRGAHPSITSLWPELKTAFTLAVENPGRTIDVRGLKFRCDGAWLRIRLPSGRCLCYPQPRVHGDGKISYMGVNQYTRKWQRLFTYGGKLFENIVQAIARDVLREGMFAAEAEGYEVVLTVHDEIIAEAPNTDAYSGEKLAEVMARLPAWAEGLPLAAAGYTTYRYRKEL